MLIFFIVLNLMEVIIKVLNFVMEGEIKDFIKVICLIVVFIIIISVVSFFMILLNVLVIIVVKKRLCF